MHWTNVALASEGLKNTTCHPVKTFVLMLAINRVLPQTRKKVYRYLQPEGIFAMPKRLQSTSEKLYREIYK